MEKCKFCDAELEEGMTLCPACGKDNAAPEEETIEAPEQETAEVPQQEETVEAPKQEPEKTAVHRASPAILAAGVILAVALVAVLIALLIGGRKESTPAADAQLGEVTVDGTADPTAETVPPTIPEGSGDTSSVTYKGTYTVSDEEIIANKDLVVATAGEHELTLGELQIYYWQEVSGFLNQYGYYAYFYGLDTSLPLDVQECMVMEGMTWQQFFLYSAVNSWHSYLALDLEAGEAGYQMPQEYQEHVDTIPQQLEEQAVTGGYESVDEMVAYNLGAGVTVEDFTEFMEVYYHGYFYFNELYAQLTATDEEIEAEFAEREAEFAESGVTKESKSVNVRHILIQPETSETETAETTEGTETTETTEPTRDEDAWAAAEATAQSILDQWLAGDMTEESFAALAMEYNQDPGSAGNGGLYTDVTEGMMVPAFNDWCFDPARKVGDYGIVETDYGYHIMYYSGETYLWISTAEQYVISEKANQIVDAALAKHPLTVYYDRIALSLAGAFKTY